MSIEIENALNVLKKSMKDDPDYAYGWHDNIAMACYDQFIGHLDHGLAHFTANKAATTFMKSVFDIETSNDMPREPNNPGA